MGDLATVRANFLAKVELYAPGQSGRFTPALDELIRWSEENAWGLQLSRPGGSQQAVRFCVPGIERPFWSAVARSSDGARFAVLDGAHPRFTDELRDEARAELTSIAGAAADPDAVPELAFAKLIWPPYRERVLGLMTRLLGRVHGRVETTAPGAARSGP